MASYPIPGHVPLRTDEVQVWRANLDVGPNQLELLWAALSREEQERARRFLLPIDRDRFAAGRGILRRLLGAYLHQSPGSVCIEIAAHGKPRVGSALGASDLRFNLSHSHGLAWYAFSLQREVGVDIEKIRPELATEGAAERYFSRREMEELRVMPSALRSEAFFRCWTSKEAYLKARGVGLHAPLESFTISCKPNQLPVLTSPDSVNWRLYAVPPPSGFAAALVVEGPPCKVVYADW